MFKAKSQVLLYCLVLISCPGWCLASNAPEALVQELAQKVKAAGSPAPVLKHVHWETAYKEFPADQKEALSINSPAELKQYYTTFFSNPQDFARSKMLQGMKNIPNEARPQIEGMMKLMEANMGKQVASMQEKIRSTNYEVTGSKINGDRASVTLVSSRPDKTSTSEVRLVSVSNQWYLASPVLSPSDTAGLNLKRRN